MTLQLQNWGITLRVFFFAPLTHDYNAYTCFICKLRIGNFYSLYNTYLYISFA